MNKSHEFAVPVSSVVLLVAMVLLNSCSKLADDFDFRHIGVQDYRTSWVTNLVDAEASIGDFVPDTISGEVSLVTSGDNRFFIAYELDYHTDTLDVRRWISRDSVVGDEIRYIDNVDYPKESSTTFEMELDFPFAKIDTIYLKSGEIELNVTTPTDTAGIGLEVQSNLLLEESGGTLKPFRCVAHWGRNVISLKDKYIIVNDSNYCMVKLQYHTRPFTGLYADSSKAPLYIHYNLSIPEFHFITGTIFRDTSIELFTGKVDYSLLPENMGFGLHLNHLFLNTDIATNVGIPISCDIEYLKYHNNLTNKTYDFLSAPYCLRTLMPRFRGDVSHTLDTIRINHDAVFSNDGYIDFSSYASLKRGRFFIDENARYDVHAHLEFPLDMTVEQFHYADTLDFPSLDAIDSTMDKADWNWVQSLLLRCEFVNGLPLELGVQLYFMDSNYCVRDSLFTDRSLLQGALVDPLTGLVKEPVHVPAKFITFDRERVKVLSGCRYMLLDANAVSTGNQRVVLAADQKLRVRIGARVNAKFNYRSGS